MKILKNKYFILGNIALLLAAIPLTLLFISRQQDVRSRAAPTTTISFSPQTISFEGDQCSAQTTTVKIDPGENLVSSVELFLSYDSTKFDITIEPNESAFPEVLRGPTYSNGQASVVLKIGSSVENAISVPVDMATITIVPVGATTDDPATISIDSSKTRVLSLNTDSDGITENVFLSGGQAAVNINAECIDGNSIAVSPTPSGTVSPTPTGQVGGANPTATPTVTGGPTASPTTTTSPTSGSNQAPICNTLASSPSASGNAPFVVTLTAQGTDSNGTIAKATFNFGDNTIQDVFSGLGTATATTQLSHTYQTQGTYSASVIFTDNGGAVSSACTQQITVLASNGTTTPTPTTGGIVPTATATPTPAIESPGGIGTTVAVLGGLLLVILGGLALIVL